MSYQVIARKWRPKDFNEVVGQSHVSQTLLNALKSERLPHALLFTGPRGTGKTSSARILAKSLRCPNAVDFIPCGQCPECEDISNGSSVNIIEIDGASNNGVEAIRELRESVGYMPSSGKYKVYIIDEVHMLSTSAFNALLKTLEEPPGHVIFVLATTEVQKIPNTILSRCQRFDFRRISLKAIGEHLKSICEAEGVQAEMEALWMIARQGDGSMRDSQSLLDQVITFCEKDIRLEKVVDILGLTDRRLLLDTVESLIQRNTGKIVDVIDRIFNSGFDAKVYIQDLLEEFRHLLLIKICQTQVPETVDLPESEIQRLRELGQSLSEEDIHLLFDMTLKGANDLSRSEDPRIVLEMILLRMSQAPRIQNILDMKLGNTSFSSPSPTLKKKTVSEQHVQPKPIVENEKPQIKEKPPLTKAATLAAESPTTPSVPEGPEEQKWLSLVKQIKTVNGLMGAQLENTYLLSLEKNLVKIGIPPKMSFLYEKLNTPQFIKKMGNYLNTYWGEGFAVEVSLGEEKKSLHSTPKALKEKQLKDKNKAMHEEVENHPLVQQTQRVFKTQIKSIREK